MKPKPREGWEAESGRGGSAIVECGVREASCCTFLLLCVVVLLVFTVLDVTDVVIIGIRSVYLSCM